MNTEFAALAARVPGGTICLSSGLSYWEHSLAALARYTRQAGADYLRLTALTRQLGGERRIREALEVILA